MNSNYRKTPRVGSNSKSIINESILRVDNKILFHKFIREIKKTTPLTCEEEEALLRNIQVNNDPKDLETLVQHNLFFVIKVAKTYSDATRTSLVLEDLIAFGYEGLLTAVYKYKPQEINNEKIKFISYAVWWIRHHILKAIQENIRTVRVPHNVQSIYSEAIKIRSKLEQVHSRDIDNEEIADYINDNKITLQDKINLEKINTAFTTTSFESSIDRPVSHDSTENVSNLLESHYSNVDEDMIKDERKFFVYKMLNSIPEQHIGLFIDYYGLFNNDKLTLKELGEKYNCLPSTASMRITLTQKSLKKKFNRQLNAIFLD